MAVIRKSSLDCLLLIFFSFLLLAARIVVSSEGNTESPTTASPTVYQCRSHIEAALKEFITKEQHDEPISPVDQQSEDQALHSEEPLNDNTEHEDEAISERDVLSEAVSEIAKALDSASEEEGEEEGEAEDATHTEADDETIQEDATKAETEGEGTATEDVTKDETEREGTADEDATEAGEQATQQETDETEEAEVGEEDKTEHETEGTEGTEDEDDDEKTQVEDDDEKTQVGDDESVTEKEEAAEDVTEKDEISEQETQEEETAATEKESGDLTEMDEQEKEGEETDKEDTITEDEALHADEPASEDEEATEKPDESEEVDNQAESEATTAEGSQQEGEEVGEAEEESKADDTQVESDDDEIEGTEEPGKDSEEQTAENDEETEAGVSVAGEPDGTEDDHESDTDKTQADTEEEEEEAGEEESEEEELINLRSHDHITEILGLDEESMARIIATEKSVQDTLKELKRMYESAIKPMEGLYKFKDISNRYVGDAELFSKPMILFIGPWSSGKSAMINYLLDIEDTKMALTTGAEPQSNGFTVLMYGSTEQQLDGIEIAADWTFSSLQKFGESFLNRLQGVKLPNNLLRKVTIVDTPGILENRKQQERTYPFNDACQWFIDRADIIYVIFDPTKLDMGLEIEALFDQLKGREAQVRILLNKADSVKPQELMRVQSTLLWNLSPLLGSSEPPIIFVGTFWSRPYLPESPETLFDAQEAALLLDLKHTIDGRVENKISFTRRHAVRVRNHAKMVDCYLNTYYNHKTFFSNKKKVADEIIENPQNYHIYEGLSTLTNVSRYDLPDPDIYRDFFRVNPLYEFKLLASTCSFFKGCPLDKLDVAIAYDLPELMGKYRKAVGASAHNDRR